MSTTLISLSLILAVAGCKADPSKENLEDASVGSEPDSAAPDASSEDCSEGLACLFYRYDQAAETCDDPALEAFAQELGRHRLPVWHEGRALFRTEGPAAIAGDFNEWDAQANASSNFCESGTWISVFPVSSGHHTYKLVKDEAWQLDPNNWAFAYDDFAGNADKRNSVLNTYDSGLGHLVQPSDWLCSDALGNCRPLTVYLPPGYAAPENMAREYPTIFMHDGQNIFDDKGCCFGQSGWELNRALDGGIANGELEETIIVGFDHAGAGRFAEYGGSSMDDFMSFQVTELQPLAMDYFRIADQRIFTAGSSLGGLIAFRLAMDYPNVYSGAASLSGAFQVRMGDGLTIFDRAGQVGMQNLTLYLDHGGTAEAGGDGYGNSVALANQLEDLGYVRAVSPGCTGSGPGLCYHHENGAQHNEPAWRERSWRFLQALVPR